MENPKIIKCPWDLNTYFGRWVYYSWITNLKLNFVSNTEIEEAKLLRLSYINGSISKDITNVQLYHANQVYESVFHPDTGEVQNIFGRISFIPIGKSILVAPLLNQLTRNSCRFVLHGVNQSYDSFVNFTNRNGYTNLSQAGFITSILAATALSTFAAFHTERFLTSKICRPLLYRFIPFSTFLVASIINVPIMRHREIMEGVVIYDCDKNQIGHSKFAAAKGIGETIVTRIVMFAPGLFAVQYLKDVLDNQNCWFRKNKWSHVPFNAIVFGLILIGMLPTALAIFPQFSSVKSSTLKKFDSEAYGQIETNSTKIPNKVYFNKGL